MKALIADSPYHNCWTILFAAPVRTGWSVTYYHITVIDAVDAARSAYDRSGIVAYTVYLVDLKRSWPETNALSVSRH